VRRENELDTFDESDPKRLETEVWDFYANALRNYSVACSKLLRAAELQRSMTLPWAAAP
jgi:hypothetical protein